ncbi:CDP-alcohol phosphatidyltransferase family protein, partial [Methylopila musalis]
MTTKDGGPAAARVAVLLGRSEVRIWGMSAQERLTRQLGRAGARDVRTALDGIAPDAQVLLLRVDHAFEQRLVDALAIRPGAALV